MEDYILQKRIHTNIFRARNKKTNIEVILKTTSHILDLCNEITLLGQIKHPNVIGMYSSFVYSGSLYIVLELGCIDLFSILSNFPGRRMPEYIIKNRVVEPITKALEYIHSKGIIHRDIKPENIIVMKNGETKLCDFGLSCVKTIDSSLYCGTKEFMAPEIQMDKTYDEKIDIWAFGCVIYELIYGIQFYKSVLGFQEIRDVSQDAINFVRHMLVTNPLLRPSASKLLTKLWTIYEQPQRRSISLTDLNIQSPKRRNHLQSQSHTVPIRETIP